MFCTILSQTNNTDHLAFHLLRFENSVLGKSFISHAWNYWTEEKVALGLESISVQNRMEGFSVEVYMIFHF